MSSERCHLYLAKQRIAPVGPQEKYEVLVNLQVIQVHSTFKYRIKNYLIEFDGEQHFKLSTSSAWNDKCATLQERDTYKNQWCKDNNIPLIRIPYTHLKQLCLEDLLPATS